MFNIKLPQLNQTLRATTKVQLMDFLLQNGIPVASSCGGEGICTKCKLRIAGSPLNSTEANNEIKRKNSWLKDEHASCQVTIEGDLTIWSTYW